MVLVGIRSGRNYTYDEALKESLEYFNGNKLAAKVFLDKYALRDKEGNYRESNPDQMHQRLAHEFARIDVEKWGKDYEERFNVYYDAMKSFSRIVPQGSPMAAIGNVYQAVSASSCVVINSPEDSMEGIIRAGEALAQLMKRRCVEENTFVVTKERGCIPIKDVEIGMHVLSFDVSTARDVYRRVLNVFETEVPVVDRVEVKLTTGATLRTSRKHPMLCFANSEYSYKEVNYVVPGDICVKPALSYEFNAPRKDWVDIGWLIGFHMGDGSVDVCRNKNRNYKPVNRVRATADDEASIANYGRIWNKLTESACNYHLSYRTDYQTDVWEYVNVSRKSDEVVERLFDGQVGSKTYNGYVPSIVREEDLWLPFLAGLIDSDGYIRTKGCTISIRLCAKSIVDELSVYLASRGVFITTSEIQPRRSNEAIQYGLSIHQDRQLWRLLLNYMVHPSKRRLLEEASGREWSHAVDLSPSELVDVVEAYNNLENKPNALAACICLLRKHGRVGRGALNTFVGAGIMDEEKSRELLQRVRVANKLEDKTSERYIDIEVDATNNFYAGNCGLVNIHNCGVGLDISSLRPEGFAVNNAAKTTSGAWSFADFYSYVTRMVCQCLYKNTRVLTKHGIKKISDVVKGDRVWTESGWVPVLKVLKSRKSLVRLRTKFGRDVVCSKDHVFHTIEGEKPVSSLSVGAPITSIAGIGWQDSPVPLDVFPYERVGGNNSNRLNEDVLTPTTLDSGLAYVVGYSYGDGYVGPNSISLATAPDWPEIESKLLGCIEESLGYAANVSAGDGCGRIRIHSRVIREHLRKNGLLKEKSHEIEFPEKLWSASEEVLFAFLSGYFDADGTVLQGKKCYRVASTSKAFLQDTQIALQAHGVVSRIHKQDRSKEGWRPLYALTVNGNKSQRLFRQLMQESVKVSSVEVPTKKRDFVRTCYQTEDFGTRAHKHSYIIDDRLCEDLEKGNDFFLLQDFVEDVTDLEEEDDVYDLVLAHTHLFSANGLYAHNSGRRGALMITMDVHHPDIMQFIKMKQDKTKVTGANVSVKFSDAFMLAVEKDEEYEQRWPVEGTSVFTRMVKAREVWDAAVHSATTSAEPGCIFWDTLTKRLPPHSYPDFKTVSTNPCSEIGLSPFDSCRLISINLTHYVVNAFHRNQFSPSANFQWPEFAEDIKIAMQMSDNLVDLEIELIDRILERCDNSEDSSEQELWAKLQSAGIRGRRVGLGTHGLGDALAQLGIAYDSNEAIEFVDILYRFLRDHAYRASIELAKERGTFPSFDWEQERHNDYIMELPEDIKQCLIIYGRRNIACLTQAPGGSISIESKTGRRFNRYGVSSGIEPMWRVKFTRKKKISSSDDGARVDFVDEMGDSWQEYEVLHPNVENYLDSVEGASIDDLPDYFVASDEIDWIQRVKLQGAEQKYIDHSISSTINLPKDTPAEVVGNIYMQAWKSGCKGVTVYVDGTRENVLSGNGNGRIDPKERPEKIVRMQAPKRPRKLECDIHHTTCQGKKYIALVGILNGEPYEFFGGYPAAVSIPKRLKHGQIVKKNKNSYWLHVGKNGDTIIIKDIAQAFSTPEMGWTTRLVSASLRHGTPIDFLVEQLSKTGNVSDFNRVIARVLKKYIKDGSKVRSSLKCGECGGSNMVWQDCPICMDCGASKCN